MMNRPPAYQFYPDVWATHTSQLSDASYRVYHQMCNWMWLHADDYGSIPADPGDIAFLLGVPCERIETALAEIQHPRKTLLRTRGDDLVCKRLLEYGETITAKSAAATKAANTRWAKELGKDAPAMQTKCEDDADAMHSSLYTLDSSSTSKDSVSPPESVLEPCLDLPSEAVTIAEHIRDTVISNKNVKFTAAKLTALKKQVCDAERLDGVSFSRQLAAARHYRIYYGEKYVPIIEGAASYREKLGKMENNMRDRARDTAPQQAAPAPLTDEEERTRAAHAQHVVDAKARMAEGCSCGPEVRGKCPCCVATEWIERLAAEGEG